MTRCHIIVNPDSRAIGYINYAPRSLYYTDFDRTVVYEHMSLHFYNMEQWRLIALNKF